MFIHETVYIYLVKFDLLSLLFDTLTFFINRVTVILNVQIHLADSCQYHINCVETCFQNKSWLFLQYIWIVVCLKLIIWNKHIYLLFVLRLSIQVLLFRLSITTISITDICIRNSFFWLLIKLVVFTNLYILHYILRIVNLTWSLLLLD